MTRMVFQAGPEFNGSQVSEFFVRDGLFAFVGSHQDLFLLLIVLFMNQQTRRKALASTRCAFRVIQIERKDIVNILGRFHPQIILGDILFQGITGGVITSSLLVDKFSSGKGDLFNGDGSKSIGLKDGVHQGSQHDDANQEKLLASFGGVARLAHGQFVVIHQHGGKGVLLLLVVFVYGAAGSSERREAFRRVEK